MDAFIWQLVEVRKGFIHSSPKKWTSSLMTDWIALRAREGVCWASDEMVLLSINV